MTLRVDNSLNWMLAELSVLQLVMTWLRSFVLLHVPDSPLEWLEGAKRSGIDRAFPIFRQKTWIQKRQPSFFAVSVFPALLFRFWCLTCRLFEFAVIDVHSLTCASFFFCFGVFCLRVHSDVYDQRFVLYVVLFGWLCDWVYDDWWTHFYVVGIAVLCGLYL